MLFNRMLFNRIIRVIFIMHWICSRILLKSSDDMGDVLVDRFAQLCSEVIDTLRLYGSPRRYALLPRGVWVVVDSVSINRRLDCIFVGNK